MPSSLSELLAQEMASLKPSKPVPFEGKRDSGIPGMNEEEKLDRFCSGRKNEVKLEVLKTNPVDLNAAAQNALNVDNAFYCAGMFSRGSQSGSAGACAHGDRQSREWHALSRKVVQEGQEEEDSERA